MLEFEEALARVLASEPEVILLDEPFSALDTYLRSQMEQEMIERLRGFDGVSLFVTHNLEEAVYLAERILVMTQKPTRIKEEVKVDLPRPRNYADPKFVEIRRYVTDLVKWW